MPTKDHLSKIDEEHVLYLTQVNCTSVVWVLPYVYELVIVKARNACSHNIYDSATVRDKLSDILYSIFTELGIELYLQLHYSIVFLLRKENIYE